jgi:hypothetical protein
LAQRDAEQATFVPVRLLVESGSQNGALEVLLACGRRLRVARAKVYAKPWPRLLAKFY